MDQSEWLCWARTAKTTGKGRAGRWKTLGILLQSKANRATSSALDIYGEKLLFWSLYWPWVILFPLLLLQWGSRWVTSGMSLSMLTLLPWSATSPGFASQLLRDVINQAGFHKSSWHQSSVFRVSSQAVRGCLRGVACADPLCVCSSCAWSGLLEQSSDLALGAGPRLTEPRLIISLCLSQVRVALASFLVSTVIFSSWAIIPLIKSQAPGWMGGQGMGMLSLQRLLQAFITSGSALLDYSCTA